MPSNSPPPPPNPTFQIFENAIYSKKLKLLVAVHLSSAEILICQLCVYHFDVAIATPHTCVFKIAGQMTLYDVITNRNGIIS